jgi:hypothetical protein
MKIIDPVSCDCSLRDASCLKPDYAGNDPACVDMAFVFQDALHRVVPIISIGRDGL